MAAANCKQVVGECFTIGSIVVCKTCYNQDIEGEVVAFDPQSKMLILTECPSSCGDVTLRDVHIVNLALVSDVQVKQEGLLAIEPPQSLNLQRLNTRIRNQIDEKRRMVTALSAGVSPDGQRLFMQIAKTIKEVTWRGSDIVVWQQEVIICPPYGVDDIRGDKAGRGFNYIRKVVEKHLKDQAAAASSPTSTGVNNLAANQSSVAAAVGQQ